ncbi:aminotransferase class I/II-fold pyridoxal phosphate-dependent enzyme [Escherichia coli]
MDSTVGTFSKSLASFGGFAVGSEAMAALALRQPPVDSYRLPSSALHCDRAPSLRTIATQPELRQKLMDNANHLYDCLQKLGYELSSHISPVVPVIIGSKRDGLRIWRELISLGVYVNLILPPAAPAGITLLRCSLNAAHSRRTNRCHHSAFATLKQYCEPAVALRTAGFNVVCHTRTPPSTPPAQTLSVNPSAVTGALNPK